MTRRSDNRETRLPARRGELPSFTPVARKGNRHDGWTQDRQRRFIEALADTGSVDAACRAVNMSQRGAYHLRRQPGAASFRKAWQKALDLGIQRVEDVAMDRALNGVEVPVYSYGKLVGKRTVYNDRLLMFMLRNRAPERFAGSKPKSPDAIGKMELERQKKQWRAELRKEWEKEAFGENEQEVLDSIDVVIDEMKAEHLARLDRESPRTIAARTEYERLKAEDEAAGYDYRKDPDHPLYEPTEAAPPPEPDPTPALPPPGWSRYPEKEPEEKPGPRVRTVKDEGW